MNYFEKLKSRCIEWVPEFVHSALRPPLSGGSARWAVLGDIHANLEALNAVLADAREQGVSRFVCTGDVVGYGANPSACLKIVRDLNCPVVKGNHDFYAATDESLKEFSLHAMNAVLWTREHLSTEERVWLNSLPLQRECRMLNDEQGMQKDRVSGVASIDIPCSTFCGSVLLVHSSVFEPSAWRYVIKQEEAEKVLPQQEVDLVFFGHTHIPSWYAFHPDSGEVKSAVPMKAGVLELEAGWKWLLNPGSVGQPRDHDARASYLICDPAAGSVEWRRVEYDIERTAKKIIEVGLPERNALRLHKGR